MFDFTFLTKNQIFGDEKLDIFSNYGIGCEVTDFAILLGAYADEEKKGVWWSRTPFGDYRNGVLVVNKEFGFMRNFDRSFVGARPTFSYSSIASIAFNENSRKTDIYEVVFGEYPQTVVDKEISQTLENLFNSISSRDSEMTITGKSYTTNSVDPFDVDNHYKSFKERKHVEYEYKGKKYIRFLFDFNPGNKSFMKDVILSDKRVVKYGNVYWLEVEPIVWMIDKKTNIALSKKILFSGVQYDNGFNFNWNFDETDIKKFMDEYFAKDIVNDRLVNIGRRINEIDDNINVKYDLQSFAYKNINSELFSDLNRVDKKWDSFISCMNLVFDSDSYYEMNSKLNLLKKAIFTYEKGNKKKAFELIKEIDSDIHKERIDGKVVAYPTGCINMVEKPKRIIDRMKYLYPRIDDSCNCDYLDSIHEKASSLNDLINRKNCYMFYGNIKRKVKSIFTKEKANN